MKGLAWHVCMQVQGFAPCGIDVLSIELLQSSKTVKTSRHLCCSLLIVGEAFESSSLNKLRC